MFSLDHPHGQGGVFFSWQKTSGGYLATTGYNQAVHIYDRHGGLKEQIHMPGLVLHPLVSLISIIYPC